ncbi:hypothetical protein SUGI_0595020 [Cryptomeria japonica]|nr:hypothetical protein SUGI_0595020 [Cryptomeria japonica]
MARIYVGNLDPRVTERELEDEFRVFGVLRSVWVARKPPGFAFIEFEDRRDANDAVRGLNGKNDWRVELSRSSGGGQTMAADLEVAVHGIVGVQVMERVRCAGATHHAVILHIERQSVPLSLIVTMQHLELQMGVHIIEIVSGTEVAARDNLDVFCRNSGY